MAQPTKPGNAERGWNDPPMFLYSGGNLPQNHTPSKRTPLTKRVAHPGIFGGDGPGAGAAGPGTGPAGSVTGPVGPGTVPASLPPLLVPSGAGNDHSQPPPVLDTSSAPPSTNALDTQAPDKTESAPPKSDVPSSPPISVVLLPPATSTDIPKFTAPIIVPTMSPVEDCPLTAGALATNPVYNTQVNTENKDRMTGVPDFDNDPQMFHFVLSRLQKACADCTSVVQSRVTDDIKRKLDIFSDAWTKGKISYPVKSSMTQLAAAIHRRDCDVAHEIHLALMMDYISEVGQWMVGIKRLIQESRNTAAPLSPTDSTTMPLLLDSSSNPTSESEVNQFDNVKKSNSSEAEPGHIFNNIDIVDDTSEKQSLDSETVNSTVKDRSSSPAVIETTAIDN